MRVPLTTSCIRETTKIIEINTKRQRMPTIIMFRIKTIYLDSKEEKKVIEDFFLIKLCQLKIFFEQF